MALASLLQRETYFDKNMVLGNKNNLLRIWKFQGGGGHQNTPWNGNSKGMGGGGAEGVVEKPFHGEYGNFLELHNNNNNNNNSNNNNNNNNNNINNNNYNNNNEHNNKM